MNILEFLFNSIYRLAEGDPSAQRMIAAAAQGYNDQMARINRTPSIPALTTANCEQRRGTNPGPGQTVGQEPTTD